MDPQPEHLDHEKEKIERLRRAMYSRELSGQIKDRPRHTMESTNPTVGDDWKRPEPELKTMSVAPRTIAIARSALRWMLVAAVVFFIAALGFLAYYFTIGGGASPSSPGNIDVVISGPLQVAGGEPTQLQITVTNRNKVALQLADLVITYPQGTRSPLDLVTDLSSQRISLGDIEPGGRRQGTVSAVFSGGVNTSAKVNAELEYRLQGSSAIFVASGTYDAAFSAAALAVSVEGNTETVSGQPVEFTVTVTSNANAPVKDVLLSAGFPFGFSFSSATPKPTQGTFWELGDIAPGQKKEIIVRGTLTGESADERVFRFTTGTRKSAQDSSISTTLAESSFPIKISEPFLGLSVSVGGRSDPKAVVAPGETVNVTINWENNLRTAITDAVIVARLSGLQIDGTAIKTSTGFFRSTDGTIIWDKTTTAGDLGNLAAGARGSVGFTVRIPPSTSLGGLREPSLTITVNAGGKRVSEEGVPENLQATALQRIDVTTSLTATSQGLYYANPFGSVGPLPPKSGVETTYGVVFTLTNTTNAIENAKLTASLPPYVRWTGVYSPSGEKLTFNQSDGTITWDIGTINPGVGLSGTLPRQAAISVGFTPSTSQIGQSPPLVQNIRLVGTDATTGVSVNRSLKDVTTNIVGDAGFNSSEATVVR